MRPNVDPMTGSFLNGEGFLRGSLLGLAKLNIPPSPPPPPRMNSSLAGLLWFSEKSYPCKTEKENIKPDVTVADLTYADLNAQACMLGP